MKISHLTMFHFTVYPSSKSRTFWHYNIRYCLYSNGLYGTSYSAVNTNRVGLVVDAMVNQISQVQPQPHSAIRTDSGPRLTIVNDTTRFRTSCRIKKENNLHKSKHASLHSNSECVQMETDISMKP